MTKEREANEHTKRGNLGILHRNEIKIEARNIGEEKHRLEVKELERGACTALCEKDPVSLRREQTSKPSWQTIMERKDRHSLWFSASWKVGGPCQLLRTCIRFSRCIPRLVVTFSGPIRLKITTAPTIIRK